MTRTRTRPGRRRSPCRPPASALAPSRRGPSVCPAACRAASAARSHPSRPSGLSPPPPPSPPSWRTCPRCPARTPPGAAEGTTARCGRPPSRPFSRRARDWPTCGRPSGSTEGVTAAGSWLAACCVQKTHSNATIQQT
eukprot:2645793-Prymnesium_polylepis.1